MADWNQFWAKLGLMPLLATFCFECQSNKSFRCTRDDQCPSSQQWCDQGVCRFGSCPDRPCELGYECVEGSCYVKDCETRPCPGKGEVCVEEDCVPKECLEKICPEKQRCAADGNCYPIDCSTQFCLGYGEICIDDTECIQRSCVDKSCPVQNVCANGYCYPTNCGAVSCPDGEVCDQDGECIEKSCVGLICQGEQICVNGRCCELQEFGGETSCLDGVDNDCDSLVDCLDPDCNGKTCTDLDPNNDPDSCQNSVCTGSNGGSCIADESPQELTCIDDVDNDCDGMTDCDDNDCLGAQDSCGRCDSGSSSCQVDHSWSICSGEIGCEPGTTEVCGSTGCGEKTCQNDCNFGGCVGDEAQEVCDQCSTGTCADVLTRETCSSCGCADSIPYDCVNIGATYDVPCPQSGCFCYYKRERVYEDCRCRWECV